MDPAADQPAVTLDAIKPGNEASIVKISGTGSVRRRLLDMGATAGTVVCVKRVAPLGDPIEIKIKGYHLTLRKEEARRIAVTPI
jgi:ferrous iron transport protein A